MFKRISAIILGLIITLTACGQTAESDTTQEEEPLLSGYVYNLVQDRETDFMIFYYDISTVIGDYMLTHVDNVANKLGCDIVIDGSHGFSGTAEYVSSSIATGAPFAETVHITGNNYLATLAYADMLYPISDFIDTLDYKNSTKYGYPSNLEAAMKDSTPYAVQPTLWPASYEVIASLIIFNNGIFKEADIEDPRELLESNSWTWDNFTDLIAKSTIDNGTDKIYGLATNPAQLVPMVILSNGVELVTNTGEALTTDIYSDKTVKAIEYMQMLYKDYSSCITTKENGTVWNVSKLLNGKAAMEMSYGLYAINGALQYDSKIDFGILPFPCGPDGVYGKWAHQTEAIYGFAIPIVADMPEYAAIVIDELFEPIEPYAEITKEEYYAQNVFLDPRDAHTYCEIAKNGRYSYWTVGGTDFYTSITNSFSTKTAAQLIESYAPSYEKFIEEYMMPNYDYLAEFVFN